MYSPASLPLEHAPVASCSSKTKPGELEDSVLQLVQEHHHASLRIHKLTEKANYCATISQFVKRTDQWLSVVCSINTAIKEIGDFENWMKIMEFDSQSITAAIHNIHQA